jgi:Ca2+-binding EF-hand superfamily protein
LPRLSSDDIEDMITTIEQEIRWAKMNDDQSSQRENENKLQTATELRTIIEAWEMAEFKKRMGIGNSKDITLSSRPRRQAWDEKSDQAKQMTKKNSVRENNTKIVPVSRVVYTAENTFGELDRDGNGSLDRNEVRAALNVFDDWSDNEFEAFFGKLDKDGDGEISLKEYKKGLYKRFIFQTLDKDGDERLSKEETRAAFSSLLGKDVDAGQFEKEWDNMEKADGGISFKEFKKQFFKKKKKKKRKKLLKAAVLQWEPAPPPLPLEDMTVENI